MKVRVGVIGAGDFAEVCHVPCINAHPQAEVVALCGRRYDFARGMADRLGVPDVHTDYRELCNRPDIDAVTIATPNAEHAKQALAAFETKKHVFCEKPLGITVAETRQMLRAAEASGKVHQVGFTYRYDYAVQELRRRVRCGDIGQPYYIRLQYDSWHRLRPDWKAGGWREKCEEAGAGILYDVGAHLFDLAYFILGPIEAVTAFGFTIPHQPPGTQSRKTTSMETDDITAAWFRHESGVHGQCWMSRATPPHGKAGYMEVIGPEGALKASLSRGTIDWLKVSRPNQPEWKELPLQREAKDGTPHCLDRMMRSFVDACVRGRLDGDVDADFNDGHKAQQALAATLEANDRLAWVPLAETELEQKT